MNSIDNINIESLLNQYTPQKPSYKKYHPTSAKIKQILQGIIIGDIIGSPYEFGYFIPDEVKTNYKTIDLLTPIHRFTDDSVMSIAIYEATKNIIENNLSDTESLKEYIRKMREYAQRYPDAGYGGMFYNWAVLEKEDERYASFGDGSAMRSGVVGAMFERVEDVIKYTAISCYPTHSHPEGMKGGIVTAVLVWMSLSGFSKEDMKEYVSHHYPDNPSQQTYFAPVYPSLSIETVSEEHKYQTGGLDCPTAVSLAFINFYCSDNFDECLRNCLRYPSDCDTVMAISGGFSCGFYNADKFQGEMFREIIEMYLSDDLKEVVL